MDKGIPKEIQDRLEYITSTHNGGQPEVVGIRPIPAPCDDCDLQIEKEMRVVTLRRHLTPYVHWRKRCRVCKLFLNEETGKFDSTSQELTAFYHNLRRTTKYNCKSK